MEAVKTKSKKRNETFGFKPKNIEELMQYSRAIEAVNWGMSLANFQLMFQAAKTVGASFNQIVYWSELFDWKNQTLTPNPDVIYLMPFFNTRDVGPVVLEIPAAEGGAINGSIMDCWQCPLEDVGPAGVDKGKGGKYLILPPGYKEKIPDGYIALASDNYQGYALLRSLLISGSKEDIEKAISYAKKIKLYAYAQAASPPKTVFVDAAGKLFDATIPYDLRFFQSLDKMIQDEPWLRRDMAMIDPLKSLGIEKGKSFNPAIISEEILNDAARDAHSWLDHRYEKVLDAPFFENSHWAFVASKDLVEEMPSHFANADHYPIDSRGVTYTFAFFAAKHLGQGQYYLLTNKDKNGKPLKGDMNYRLKVPTNVPVKQYWSATAYDRSTHALIRNVDRASRSSQNPGLLKNTDGSVDIYFGPQAPAGKESNWVPTSADGEFEVLFRFYGPEKALFDKTWKMGDVESV